ncbi:adenylate kinase-like protein 1 [Plasmodium relictum]|uniref:Adenylate kinase isoenzyme 6 homolog n=1 Tax=Plasmodium relictum TaxID=85471 RepID=A0A1J1HGS3_PLARL|nr:adenylate kinase-like protein 1 [Plasmodium relictum]CRH03037.1 adenylate kinase-like protein 1 [Plasmodium relictum]
MRFLPNIIVTGVPGVGKSTLCEELEELINKEIKKIKKTEDLKVKHLNLSNIIKEERLYEEFDDELDASIYSEDLVNDKLKKLKIENGGYIIDFHDVNFIEEKELIDHIFLLTIKTSKLYERLEKRNYNEAKIKNNIECEIFQVIKEDIFDHFENSNIFDELENNDLEQYEKNLQFIKSWILSYINQA